VLAAAAAPFAAGMGAPRGILLPPSFRDFSRVVRVMMMPMMVMVMVRMMTVALSATHQQSPGYCQNSYHDEHSDDDQRVTGSIIQLAPTGYNVFNVHIRQEDSNFSHHAANGVSGSSSASIPAEILSRCIR
jgi:hypothetical protein